MEFVKIQENEEYNGVGWDTVEILCFNYDGKGAALCRVDGDRLTVLHDEELFEVLCVGFDEHGRDVQTYREVKE